MSAHGSVYLENKKTTAADLSGGLSVEESGMFSIPPGPRVREQELWRSEQAQAGLGRGNSSFHQPAQLFSVSGLMVGRQGLYLNILCIFQGKRNHFCRELRLEGSICPMVCGDRAPWGQALLLQQGRGLGSRYLPAVSCTRVMSKLARTELTRGHT